PRVVAVVGAEVQRPHRGDYRDPAVSDPIARAEALQIVLSRVEPLPAEEMDAAAAAGRVLAEPAAATIDLPPFASSAMDGYAVRVRDRSSRRRGRFSAPHSWERWRRPA